MPVFLTWQATRSRRWPHFRRDVAGERAHSDRAPCADAVFVSPDLGKEFAAAVDDFGMVGEISGAVDHAEHLDDALDAVEAAEVFPEGREHGQADLPCGLVAGIEVEVVSDTPDHE